LRSYPPLHFLPSFPTRRSSDLISRRLDQPWRPAAGFWRNDIRRPAVWRCRPFSGVVGDFDRDGTQHPLSNPKKVYSATQPGGERSEEHTSELQSLRHLVCRLLL